jgi:hypothetical protein
MRKIILGTVIEGTMRDEDLIPAFVDEILYYDPNDSLALEIEESINNNTYDFNSERAMYDVNDLMDRLNDFADPYTYFGSHVGNGSDYGFWVDIDIDDFDGIIVGDTSEVPENYIGYALHVNDHGNMTLYDVNGADNMTEIWSVV